MDQTYINAVKSRFAAMSNIPSADLQRAAQAVSDQLGKRLDDRLLELYGYLAITRGTQTSREDVHDAWSVWMVDLKPGHRSLVPFDQLTPPVQALDQPYVDAIIAAARTI